MCQNRSLREGLALAPDYDFDLVAIGSGPAGQRAAVQAAKLGRRAAVIEKRRCVGGVCIDTGTIPSKTMREAILAYAGGSARGERLPWARPASRPSAGQLLAGVEAVIGREIEVIEQQLRRNDVTLIQGEASFLDPNTLAVRAETGTSRVRARSIVIAVGTRPAPTPGVEPDGEIVMNSDQIVNLKTLPRSLAVVGAGIIGMEYASMFAAVGVQVTLVERRERPLEFVDREIVDELMHQLRHRNVTFRLGEAVESLAVTAEAPLRAVLNLESGKRLVADAVLFSAGRLASTDSLDLSKAGLSADDRGRLKVDESFRTSVPHIFAAGDVIGHPSLAATSSEQGRLAACQALGVEARPMAGPPEHELTAARVPYETGVARYREIARGQILGDGSGFFKMLFHRHDRRLLAVHCLGTGATELVHVGQAVLGLGGGLDYFLETVFNYPTLAECYKVAALDASNKLRR